MRFKTPLKPTALFLIVSRSPVLRILSKIWINVMPWSPNSFSLFAKCYNRDLDKISQKGWGGGSFSLFPSQRERLQVPWHPARQLFRLVKKRRWIGRHPTEWPLVQGCPTLIATPLHMGWILLVSICKILNDARRTFIPTVRKLKLTGQKSPMAQTFWLSFWIKPVTTKTPDPRQEVNSLQWPLKTVMWHDVFNSKTDGNVTCS